MCVPVQVNAHVLVNVQYTCTRLQCVSMYVCMYVCARIYVLCMYVCVHVHVYMYICVHVRACIHVLCMNACTCVYMCMLCVYVLIYQILKFLFVIAPQLNFSLSHTVRKEIAFIFLMKQRVNSVFVVVGVILLCTDSPSTPTPHSSEPRRNGKKKITEEISVLLLRNILPDHVAQYYIDNGQHTTVSGRVL